jgi:rod shape-determining protein MreD
MRMTVVVAGAALVAMLLQTTIGATVAPFTEVVPNLVLVLAVYLGLRHHDVGGVLGAFLLGYTLDTFSGTLLGVHAAACTAAYVVAYLIARTLWTEDGLPAMMVVFLAALVHTVVAHGVVVLVDRAWPGWTIVLRDGLVQAVFATALTPWVFGFLRWERRLLRLA